MTCTVLGCEKLKVGIAANEGTVENLPAKYTGPDVQSFVHRCGFCPHHTLQ